VQCQPISNCGLHCNHQRRVSAMFGLRPCCLYSANTQDGLHRNDKHSMLQFDQAQYRPRDIMCRLGMRGLRSLRALYPLPQSTVHHHSANRLPGPDCLWLGAVPNTGTVLDARSAVSRCYPVCGRARGGQQADRYIRPELPNMPGWQDRRRQQPIYPVCGVWGRSLRTSRECWSLWYPGVPCGLH